jgi:AraC family transcriptional regulator of adaptative response / DNA-3-methyladenine glycosylase II
VVDREGIPGLARRLGYSTRQLQRQLLAEFGAGPLALARAQRAQTARVLIESTLLPMAEVALAAGFASVRQFNATVQSVFACSPTGLRRQRSPRHGPAAAGTVVLRLAYRMPLCPDSLFGYLAATAVAGLEEWRDGAYRRTLRLPNGSGVAALTPMPDYIACQLTLHDLRDLSTAIARCRRLLDLDADPAAVDEALAADPQLAPMVQKAQGRRVPRTVDEAELALRVVLGRQMSTAAARTHVGRLVRDHGDPVADPAGGLTHLFPDVNALAELDPTSLALPHARQRTIAALVAALATGTVDLDPGSDWMRARICLAALPGIGPWTVETIAMRALGDPDAFPATDLGVRLAADGLGLPATAAALHAHAQRWRPWRAYAVQHL